jgi:hypothetical protein
MAGSSAAAWSVAEVAQWVSGQPLGGVDGDGQKWAEVAAASCREEEIDGRTLLSYATMSRKDVKEELGIPVGNVLLEAIRQLASGGSSGIHPGHAEEGEPPPLRRQVPPMKPPAPRRPARRRPRAIRFPGTDWY